MSRSRSRFVPRMEATPKKTSFISTALFGALTLLALNIFAPNLLPITSTQVWTMRGTVTDWLCVWPIFVWGGGVTFLSGLCLRSNKDRKEDAKKLFLDGLYRSVRAGIVEEVCFRWLIFLPAIAWMMLLNYIVSGWIALIIFGLCVALMLQQDFFSLVYGIVAAILLYALVGVPPGIFEWLHFHVLGYLADATTGGYLHEYLYHPTGFAVGAAMLSTNAFFRDGHSYLGFVGALNSWFLGMLFFYLMFTFGLPAAIFIHFAYDVVVFSTGALILAWRNN